VVFAGQFCQLVVMCLRPGEEIGTEMHPDVDQFFRLEQGEARFVLDGSEDFLAHATDAVLVPAGTYHNVINTSTDVKLKLYTVYSAANHPAGTIHNTKAEALAADTPSGL
jgi:mannose-6-phosphate isomerase-like protein (cupin superfamily)